MWGKESRRRYEKKLMPSFAEEPERKCRGRFAPMLLLCSPCLVSSVVSACAGVRGNSAAN